MSEIPVRLGKEPVSEELVVAYQLIRDMIPLAFHALRQESTPVPLDQQHDFWESYHRLQRYCDDMLVNLYGNEPYGDSGIARLTEETCEKLRERGIRAG